MLGFMLGAAYRCIGRFSHENGEILVGLFTAVSTVGSMVVGNQAKQKAKGHAGQVERDAKVAQDAADAKAKQMHDENILAQSQAAGVARNALEATPKRPSSLISPDEQSLAKRYPTMAPTTTPLPTPLAPIQRKQLLGQ